MPKVDETKKLEEFEKELEKEKELEEKEVKALEKTRILTPKLKAVMTAAAILIGIYEILFIFNFNYTLYDMLARMGIKIGILKTTFQTKQGEAFVLGMILLIAFLYYPARKREKHLKKVPWHDYILTALGVICPMYLFLVYPRYIEFAEINTVDIIVGIMAIILVIEATRRVVGWVLPVIVITFLAYGLYDIAFDFSRFTKQLSFDEGIFGLPLFVMTTYVFAFLFFGGFLLRIGISDYITEFMIALFGSRSGGPAKAAVVSSGLMGTLSGSSVANVLTTGTFTIPLMKKAGYPPEVAGAVEPVASTGGQLMPPIMGAAAFIMAELLGIPYNKIIIAAIIPALIYYSGVYLFIDLETKRLGLKGMPTESLPSLRYFLRKLYVLLPIVVITVALVWGIPPHICAISSLGVAIWVAWISKDEIPGDERLYLGSVLITMLLMFTGKELRIPAVIILVLLALLLIGLALLAKFTKFNEKLYISLLFILFIALVKYLGMIKEQVLLLSGVMGIIFSLIVGALSKSEDGKNMYSATYDSMVSAGVTSTGVMLAGASAGLIQGVLTMTGLVTKLGYYLIDLTAGNLWLLLLLTMAFSLILGMGVPTTANYIITSLVAAPAVYKSVAGLQPYSSSVPGFTTPIALLAAHFFVFYFGLLADITPPVALASYAGSALAKGDFWKTALTGVKYGLAGYIGPYIYFTHPEMFLITIESWTLPAVLQVLYDFGAAIMVMYLLAIALTGWSKKNLRKEVRAIIGVVGVASATLNIIPVAIGVAIVIWLQLFGRKLKV